MNDTEKAALERRIDELCAKVEQGKAENAKLVDVLHEVEQEAIYAYHCLQQDCVTTANSSEHFFKKWWHAECELDRAKAENAKLRELCEDMYGFIKRMDSECGDVTFSDCFDYCKHDTADDGCTKTGMCWYERRMRELGVEVDG